MAVWLRQGRQFSFSDFVWLAHQYSREVEHSDLNLTRLEEIARENREYGLEQMLCVAAG